MSSSAHGPGSPEGLGDPHDPCQKVVALDMVLTSLSFQWTICKLPQAYWEEVVSCALRTLFGSLFIDVTKSLDFPLGV